MDVADAHPARSQRDLTSAVRSNGQTDREAWLEAMRALLRAVDHAWQALATHSRMNINDVVALELLHFSGQVSTSQLRTRTGLSASAVTGLVDRLEDRELVRRTRPRHNRRLVLVELTDDGRDHAATLFDPLLTALDGFGTSTQAPLLTDQLPTIRHLISLLEHAAVNAATP